MGLRQGRTPTDAKGNAKASPLLHIHRRKPSSSFREHPTTLLRPVVAAGLPAASAAPSSLPASVVQHATRHHGPRHARYAAAHDDGSTVANDGSWNATAANDDAVADVGTIDGSCPANAGTADASLTNDGSAATAVIVDDDAS